MSAMFSARANAQGGGSGAGSGAHLIEFKAGRSTMQPGSGPTKKKVVAEKAKGTVIIKQSTDQLMHFCWKNRETGAVVDDLIIFPGDTEFKELKGCPDGQVFMLKFKSSDERRLFWIQEGEPEKDLCQKVNDALNKPPQQRLTARGGSSERSATNASAAAAGLAGLSGSEELGALGGLDQQQLMQLLQFMNQPGGAESASLPRLPSSTASTGGAAGTETAAAGAGNGNDQVSPAELSQLQQLLSNIRPGAGSSRSGGGGASVDLVDVIAGEKAAETVKNNEDRLLAHVASTDSPKQELMETVHAPQFKQASNSFGHALQTGQMAPVLAQFGISEDASKAAANGDLLEFAKKLTESEQGGASGSAAVKKEESNIDDSPKEPEPKRGKPDDEEMDLD